MPTLLSEPLSEHSSTASSSVPKSSRRIALVAWLRRFFFMTEAMGRARSRHFAVTAPGFEEYQAAKYCALTAESLAQDRREEMAALAVQREAILLALAAFRARIGLDSNADLATLWAALLHDPMGKELNSSEGAEIGRFIGADGALPGIPSAKGEQVRLVRALSTILEPLLDGFERDAASIRRVWLARLLRWLVLPLLVVGLYRAANFWNESAKVNLALHKRVELSSSYRPESYRPEFLVDGDAAHMAVHTLEEERPWARVDLGREYTIRRVVVTNRMDLTQRSVPLEIDTSLDGVKLSRFSRRDAQFQTWNATGKPTRARYVRLTMAKQGSLQLSEVEIY